MQKDQLRCGTTGKPMQTKAEDWGTHMTGSVLVFSHPSSTMLVLAVAILEKAVEV